MFKAKIKNRTTSLKHISHLFLVFLLLTWNKETFAGIFFTFRSTEIVLLSTLITSGWSLLTVCFSVFRWLIFSNYQPFKRHPTKWSNTLKQFVGMTNCLSVFDHSVKLVLQRLNIANHLKVTANKKKIKIKFCMIWRTRSLNPGLLYQPKSINPFQSSVTFLYHLKTSENLWFDWLIRNKYHEFVGVFSLF